MAAYMRGRTARGVLSITFGGAESKIHDRVQTGVLDGISRIFDPMRSGLAQAIEV
jgi:hypothetical protein